MRVRFVSISVMLLVALGLAAGEFPTVGEDAPAFALTSDKGETVKSSDLKGKWVVLYFYPKDFTSGCTVEANAFQADLEKYRSRNAEIVGVSVDSAESHKSFCTKEGLEFTLLADFDGEVSAAYNSLRPDKLSARNTFVIDPEGKIAKIFPAVKPVGHSAEVLAALDQLAETK